MTSRFIYTRVGTSTYEVARRSDEARLGLLWRTRTGWAFQVGARAETYVPGSPAETVENISRETAAGILHGHALREARCTTCGRTLTGDATAYTYRGDLYCILCISKA